MRRSAAATVSLDAISAQEMRGSAAAARSTARRASG